MNIEKKTRQALIASILCASAAWAACATASEVVLVGVFPGKAVLVIDGATPRTLAVGQTVQDVKVLAVERDSTTVTIAGRQARLTLGTPVSVAGGENSRSGESLTLVADANGHFSVAGSINGVSTRFLVDTGASSVALSPSMARAAGIDYRSGETGWAGTANGRVQVWNVRLDRLVVGDIVLTNVEGTVVQAEMPTALLGMSVLNRMEMRRDGSTMTLKRRY